MGFIKDPFMLGVPGAELLIFGLVPYSFSFRTEMGSKKIIEMKSLIYEIEYSSSKDDFQFDARVRIFKISETLKKMAIKYAKESERDDGQQ